jgi:serine/threonine-protein kinase RsbW
MDERLRLNIKNSFEAIPPANDTVTHWLHERQVPAPASYLANLAIEELITNCIKYGYDDKLEHDIEIHLSVAAGQMSLSVIDDGHEFDPLKAPAPDQHLPLEARPIGGLGIHLLRQLADRMTYERRDGHNHVTVTKKLASS